MIMASAVNFLDAWLPQLVEPGRVLVMPISGDDTGGESVCALLHCPLCARLVVVTEPQMDGAAGVNCGAADCPAAFLLRNDLPAGLPLSN